MHFVKYINEVKYINMNFVKILFSSISNHESLLRLAKHKYIFLGRYW